MKRKGFVERAFHCFLGGLALLEDKASEVLRDLEERGSRKEKEILSKLSGVKQKGISGGLSDLMERVAADLNLPTRSEIEELKRKLEAIEQMLRAKDGEAEKGD